MCKYDEPWAMEARREEKQALEQMRYFQNRASALPWWNWAARREARLAAKHWNAMWEQWGTAADMAGVRRD